MIAKDGTAEGGQQVVAPWVELIEGDCLEEMAQLPAGSVDMILTDLPYGTTQNAWDVVIPFAPMWGQFWRVLKPSGAVALTAQPPFDKVLGASQIQYLKYEWIWEKAKATGHLNTKKQPMKAHENVLIFYRKQCVYNPQMVPGVPFKPSGGASKGDNYGSFAAVRENDGSMRYPRSVLQFAHAYQPEHSTQKPVALFEYLIRTYTNPGDTVLDCCAGSGTTGIAARNTGRNAILIERDPTYYAVAERRLWPEEVLA